MAVALSSVAHRVHAALNSSVPRSHIHELLASALGYKSYAAYTTSLGEPSSLTGAEHIVLDEAQLVARYTALGHGTAPHDLSSGVRDAFAACFPGVKAYLSESDLADNIRADVEVQIAESDEFASEQAMTNTDGPPDFDLEILPPNAITAAGTTYVLEVTGTGYLDQDPDRVYSGDEVGVTARVEFSKLGRRILGEYAVEDIGCSLDMGWGDDDRDDADDEPDNTSPPTV